MPLLVDELQEYGLVRSEVRRQHEGLPQKIDIRRLHCHCPVAAENDKLEQLEKLLQRDLMASPSCENVTFDLLRWCPALSCQLLECFLDLLVIVRNILQDDINESELLLKELDCSSAAENQLILI